MPIAVICDIHIGEETAWSFVDALHENIPGVPVLLTSAYDESERASRQGNVFLQKPLEREKVLRELRRLTLQNGTRSVLIVDDNEVSRYIVRELLDRPWLEVREANNGSEALRIIAESVPDAVILDLLMPDLSGMEILRRMRADSATENVPVLIYTSKTLTAEERTQLHSMGAEIVRKEEISTRLSAQPFLDWLMAAGVSPETGTS
jgi:CheY-like chemotaxis protein